MQLEGEATSRAIRLASFVNTPLYVVHVMSIDAMEEIARARKAGAIFYVLKCTLWYIYLAQKTMLIYYKTFYDNSYKRQNSTREYGTC